MSTSGFAPVLYPEVGDARQTGATAAQARGYAAGYAEGLRRAAAEHRAAEQAREAEHRQALADAAAATRQAVASLGAAVAAVNDLVLPVVADADRVLVDAALDLAEAVLGREVADGRVTAADALRRATASATADELVSVRLHPEDAAAVERDRTASVTVVADDSIERGDAIAVLRHGWLDARIASALARARAVLTGEPA